MASPYRYEVQQIQTTGGSPTPLSGALTVSFGGDSVTVASDVTEIGMASALQSMPSVGNVQVEPYLPLNTQHSTLHCLTLLRYLQHTLMI